MKRANLNIILLFIMIMFIFPINAGQCINADDTSINIPVLDFENAEIRQVMKTLSEIGNRNIIVDKKVEGNCTIFLSDVTWKEALEAQQNALIELEKQLKIEERLEESVKVHVIPIHNAKAEEIKVTLDPLLGELDKPSVDIRTNSLVFTVTDSSLAVINDLIKKLDKETRQVSIEVKMVTVDVGSTSEMGINWSAIRDGNSATQTTTSDETKLLNIKYTGTVSNAVLEATVSALVEQNKAEMVSRPHITTQDNEEAIIRSGQQVPYVTLDQARNTVVELFDASTELVVTPHILSDNRILLDILASRRSADGVGVGLQINEEVADVKMITSDGETAVIGGMRQTQESKTEAGIPILHNIPLLGQLFKYTRRDNTKKDLIIFITPHIIKTVESRLE